MRPQRGVAATGVEVVTGTSATHPDRVSEIGLHPLVISPLRLGGRNHGCRATRRHRIEGLQHIVDLGFDDVDDAVVAEEEEGACDIVSRREEGNARIERRKKKCQWSKCTK